MLSVRFDVIVALSFYQNKTSMHSRRKRNRPEEERKRRGERIERDGA